MGLKNPKEHKGNPMRKRQPIIETENFVAVQFRPDTLPAVIDMISEYGQPFTIEGAEDGHTVLKLPNTTVKEGSFLCARKMEDNTKSLFSLPTIEEVFESYSKDNGKVEGSDVEEKLGNIEFKRFSNVREWDEDYRDWDIPFAKGFDDLKERARTGVSNSDWVSFDTYLAQVISVGLTKMIEQGISTPAGVPMETWKSQLSEARDAFKRYSDDAFTGDENMEQVEKAFDFLKDYFQHLWD